MPSSQTRVCRHLGDCFCSSVDKEAVSLSVSPTSRQARAEPSSCVQKLQQLMGQSGTAVDVSTQLGMQASELRSLVTTSWQVPDKKLAAMKGRIIKHFASNPQHVDSVRPRSCRTSPGCQRLGPLALPSRFG